MEMGVYGKNHRGRDRTRRAERLNGWRTISEGDRYRSIYQYIERLHEETKRGKKYARVLLEELNRLKQRFHGKELTRALENLISYRANEEEIPFDELLENLHGKRNLYEYFRYLTNDGKLGNYEERLKALARRKRRH